MRPDTGVSNPVHLAVVSPCSSCRNQLTVGQDNKPACPRRQLQKRIQDNQEAGLDTSNLQHLVLYGTEGTPQEGDGSYRNPVYSDDLHSILVWVADLSDNGGVRDAQGNLLTPNILSPGFDTAYIQCRPLPVTPRDNEAIYFQKGAFRENDQLEVTISARQQMTADGTEASVLIDGFAQKVNFIGNHPRKPVSKDLHPQGT